MNRGLGKMGKKKEVFIDENDADYENEEEEEVKE